MDYTIDRGLVVRSACTFEEWEALAPRFHQAHEWIQFVIGDWLNYGEAMFGEAYAQAIDPAIWDVQTLAQYQRVAAAIPPARRVPGLSFFHHRAVVALPPAEQVRLLTDAVNGDEGRPWSVARLAREAKPQTYTCPAPWVTASAADEADAETLAERLRGEGRTVKIGGR